MKYIPNDDSPHGEGCGTCGLPVVELTERNLRVLLAKLADPLSMRTIIDPDNKIAVRAVYNHEHYSDRPPGIMAETNHMADQVTELYSIGKEVISSPEVDPSSSS